MAEAARLIHGQILQMHRELRRATRRYTSNFEDPEVQALMSGISSALNQMDLIYRNFSTKGKVPDKVRRWWTRTEQIRREMGPARGDYRFEGPGY